MPLVLLRSWVVQVTRSVAHAARSPLPHRAAVATERRPGGKSLGLGVGPTQHCRRTSTGVRPRGGPWLYPGPREVAAGEEAGVPHLCVYSGVCRRRQCLALVGSGVGSDSWAPASMIGYRLRGPQSRSRPGVADREVGAASGELEELFSSRAWASGKPSTSWVAVGFWK